MLLIVNTFQEDNSIHATVEEATYEENELSSSDVHPNDDLRNKIRSLSYALAHLIEDSQYDKNTVHNFMDEYYASNNNTGGSHNDN